MFNQITVAKTKISWKRWMENQKTGFQFFEACFRGISQVVFLNNPVTGVFILIGILFQSPWIATCGLLGLISSTITAIILDLSEDQWKAGLFGFNGFLTGLACGTFHLASGHYIFSVIGFSILLGSFSTFFQIFLNQILTKHLKSSSLTFSFNLVFLLFLVAGVKYANNAFIIPKNPSPVPYLTILNLGEGLLRGISQIYLSDNIISAGFILFGMAVGSPVITLWAILGSAVGTFMAFILGAPGESVISGLWQYNSALGCMAIGGVFFSWSKRIFILAILCGVLCTLLTGTLAGLFPQGIPVATLPFCLGTTVFIVAIQQLPKANQ